MESSLLKIEAEGIIDELNLLKLLWEHGDARIVGSVVVDLIVKLDIDVHVVVSGPDLLGVVNEVYGRLLEHAKIDEVRISDFRPEGMKLGVDSYPGSSGPWSIDIWVTDKIETTGFELTDHLLEHLDQRQRRTVLDIKRYYHDRDLLKHGLSTLIYSAVVIDGVKSVDEFEALHGDSVDDHRVDSLMTRSPM